MSLLVQSLHLKPPILNLQLCPPSVPLGAISPPQASNPQTPTLSSWCPSWCSLSISSLQSLTSNSVLLVSLLVQSLHLKPPILKLQLCPPGVPLGAISPSQASNTHPQTLSSWCPSWCNLSISRLQSTPTLSSWCPSWYNLSISSLQSSSYNSVLLVSLLVQSLHLKTPINSNSVLLVSLLVQSLHLKPPILILQLCPPSVPLGAISPSQASNPQTPTLSSWCPSWCNLSISSLQSSSSNSVLLVSLLVQSLHLKPLILKLKVCPPSVPLGAISPPQASNPQPPPLSS